MGDIEPTPTTKNCHEIGVIIEAVADSQKEADTIILLLVLLCYIFDMKEEMQQQEI